MGIKLHSVFLSCIVVSAQRKTPSIPLRKGKYHIMSTTTITPVQDLMERAMDVYEVLTGSLTLYVDQYGFMTADRSEFDPGDEFTEVDAYEYLMQSEQYCIERDEHGNIIEAVVWVDFSPSTKIDLLDNTITSYYGKNDVTIKFAKHELKMDLLEELVELENA